jgi:hypothetical protein
MSTNFSKKKKHLYTNPKGFHISNHPLHTKLKIPFLRQRRKTKLPLGIHLYISPITIEI